MVGNNKFCIMNLNALELFPIRSIQKKDHICICLLDSASHASKHKPFVQKNVD